jgi:hypothetical protein
MMILVVVHFVETSMTEFPLVMNLWSAEKWTVHSGCNVVCRLLAICITGSGVDQRQTFMKEPDIRLDARTFVVWVLKDFDAGMMEGRHLDKLVLSWWVGRVFQSEKLRV